MDRFLPISLGECLCHIEAQSSSRTMLIFDSNQRWRGSHGLPELGTFRRGSFREHPVHPMPPHEPGWRRRDFRVKEAKAAKEQRSVLAFAPFVSFARTVHGPGNSTQGFSGILGTVHSLNARPIWEVEAPHE